MDTKDRTDTASSLSISTSNAVGCFLGLACGDALGRPVEFKSKAEIEARGGVKDMLGGGTHNKPPGTITDDTQLALRIARSLHEHREFAPEDVAERFVEWYLAGPFDIGITTRQAISNLHTGDSYEEAGQRVWENSPEGSNAGNGSVMRCAPYAIAFAHDLDHLQDVSRVSSAITHADPRCTWGCALLNTVLARLLADHPIAPSLLALESEDMPDEIQAVQSGIQRTLTGDQTGVSPDELENSGYVVTTLEAGLYHGLTAQTAEQAIIRAVNMGGDTDTLGAVAGAVAGARFGVAALPDRWVETIDERGEIESLARSLKNLT